MDSVNLQRLDGGGRPYLLTLVDGVGFVFALTAEELDALLEIGCDLRARDLLAQPRGPYQVLALHPDGALRVRPSWVSLNDAEEYAQTCSRGPQFHEARVRAGSVELSRWQRGERVAVPVPEPDVVAVTPPWVAGT